MNAADASLHHSDNGQGHNRERHQRDFPTRTLLIRVLGNDAPMTLEPIMHTQ